MERLLGITLFLSCLFLAKAAIIDVTTLGAKPGGGDIAPAFLKAWSTACNGTVPATILIPEGKFELEEIILQGPCKVPVEIQVDAYLTGPEDPAKITKDNEWIMVQNVEHLTISGKGTFDGKGAAKAWSQSDRCSSVASCSKLANNFAFYYVNHSTLTGITSKDSKLFHINLLGCENFTVSKVAIEAPQLSPNTDGIHVGRSTGIKIQDSVIKTGDDCVSLGDGCTNITVTGVKCGPGHGISVGSLGKYDNEQPLENILVTDCTLVNTDNGVRIKTWAASKPLTATDIRFENIKMQNVSNPIVIDQLYCPSTGCKTEPPSQVQLSKVAIKGIKGTSATPLVAKIICSRSNPCKDVMIGDVDLSYTGPQGPATSNCSNVQPTFSGTQTPKLCGPSSAGAAAPTAGAPAPDAGAPKAGAPKAGAPKAGAPKAEDPKGKAPKGKAPKGKGKSCSS